MIERPAVTAAPSLKFEECISGANPEKETEPPEPKKRIHLPHLALIKPGIKKEEAKMEGGGEKSNPTGTKESSSSPFSSSSSSSYTSSSSSYTSSSSSSSTLSIKNQIAKVSESSFSSASSGEAATDIWTLTERKGVSKQKEVEEREEIQNHQGLSNRVARPEVFPPSPDKSNGGSNEWCEEQTGKDLSPEKGFGIRQQMVGEEREERKEFSPAATDGETEKRKKEKRDKNFRGDEAHSSSSYPVSANQTPSNGLEVSRLQPINVEKKNDTDIAEVL